MKLAWLAIVGLCFVLILAACGAPASVDIPRRAAAGPDPGTQPASSPPTGMPSRTEPAPSPTKPAPTVARLVPLASPATPSRAGTRSAPTDLPTATAPVCTSNQGHFEKRSLQTGLLPLPLDFRVYVPPCYGFQADERYPVLYLIHGQSFNDDQWERLGAGKFADRLISQGEAPPFLIVMPRDRVWTSPKEDMFGQAVIEELIPWIDEHYRTLPERRYRAIGGLSRGAGWAVHLGLSRWDLFGAIGAHSLAIFGADVPYNVNRWLDSIPPDAYPRIYLDIADRDRQDVTATTEHFEALLTEKEIPHEWHLFNGYHDEAYWGAHVEDYLRWYTESWGEDRP